MSDAARVAADVASLLDRDDPLARLARLRLDMHVREESAVTVLESPSPGWSGRSVFASGEVVLDFVDGFAETDNAAVVRYCRDAGYGVDGSEPRRAVPWVPAVDSRTVVPVQVGALLRDAAVDPRDADYLIPTNAGQADPHSTDVVSPEVSS